MASLFEVRDGWLKDDVREGRRLLVRVSEEMLLESSSTSAASIFFLATSALPFPPLLSTSRGSCTIGVAFSGEDDLPGFEDARSRCGCDTGAFIDFSFAASAF